MATNPDRIFIDTNILTRATVASAPLHSIAVDTLLNLRREQAEMWISQQVIREYIANATRPQTYSQPIPIKLVLEQISRFRAQFRVAEDTGAVLDQLIQLLDTIPAGGKQIHDTNIVATMLMNEVDTLLTANVEDFRRFETHIRIMSLGT